MWTKQTPSWFVFMILPSVVKTSFPSFACCLRPVVKMAEEECTYTHILLLNVLFVSFQVLTAASIKMIAFWDIEPYSIFEVNRRFKCLTHPWNVGLIQRDYTVLYLGRLSSSNLLFVCLFVCSLFNNACSDLQCVASSERVICEEGRGVVAWFKVLSKHSPRETEENYENGWTVCG
jgi:hypothetical protein